MADEIPPIPDPKTRKTLTFTHRQVLGSGSVVAILLGLSQYKAVKDLFWTREEGKAQSAIIQIFEQTNEKQFNDFKMVQAQQIAEIKGLIVAQDTEHTHRLERLSDKIADKIKDSEARGVDRTNWLKKDVDQLHSELEMFAFKMDSNGRKKTNN